MHALLGTLVTVLLVAGLASAADDKKAHSSQAQRMTDCNAQAHDQKLAGDARKQFMSDCLKGHATPRDDTSKAEGTTHHEKTSGEHTGQGEKMKACNQEATAKDLHGDDRRHFMSQCLKGDKKS